VKYAWIEKHRDTYATTMMCELLSVSRSGLNAARRREPSKRSREDKELVEQIRAGQHKHRGRYGRRRMTPEISEVRGHTVNEKRIGRLMHEHGLQSHKRRRFRVVTTDSKHDCCTEARMSDHERLVVRFINTVTYQATSRSNLFQRKTTGEALNSAMPFRMRCFNSSID
jgi:putative transposase